MPNASSEETQKTAFVVYTDGACSGNPGPGGWGAVLRHGDLMMEISGYEAHTTNNRMEMTAVIEALKTLKESCVVKLHTDSTYLRNGITSWIKNWKRRGWKTSTGTPVKNRDLWMAMDEATQRHDIEWIWVPGHTGLPDNELADSLAREAIRNRKGR